MAANSAGTGRSAAPSLRPLSWGELFDRAFSLYFRHVITFAAVLLVIAVPIALLQFLQLYLSHDVLDAELNLIDAFIKHPSTPPDLTQLDKAVNSQSPFTGLASLALSGLTSLFGLFALPLANAAVVSGVSRAYLGLPVRFRVCYEDAFRRWGYAILLTLLWLVAAVFLAFASVFGILFTIIFIVALGTALKTVGFILGGLIGFALTIAFVCLVIMAYMAFASSFIACVLEKVDPLRAFTLGISRIFGGGLFWRSLLVAFSIFLIFIGISIIAGVVALLALYLTKSWFLYIAIAQLFNIFYIAFAFVVVAVYYYDIRIRREGFDLQLLADQLSQQPLKA